MIFRTVFAAALAAISALAAPPLTTIQDVLYKADGTRFNGTLTISWSSFEAIDATAIATQSVTSKVVDGLLRVQLVPTTTATPAIFYAVKYNSDGRIQFEETWSVPSSAQTLRVRDVRVANSTTSGNQSGGNGAVSTPVQESDVTGLIADLGARPLKGAGYAAGRVAMVNSTGAIDSVTGNPTDCVRVDGSTGPCGAGTPGFVDAEAPSGLVDGANVAFTLSNQPTPATSLVLYRNGLLLKEGLDYGISDRTITFIPAAAPQAGDTLIAGYRLAAGDVGQGGSGGIYGSYSNPDWLTSLAWTKITGVPAFEPAITAGGAGQFLRGDKTWSTLNTGAVPESSNLYFTDARARAALAGMYQAPISGAPATWPAFSAVAASGSFSDLSSKPNSDAIAEGTGNLYFTNARARAAVAGMYQTAIAGAPSTWPTFAAVAASGSYGDLSNKPTSDGVTEGVTNLYFSAARALAAVTWSNLAGKPSLSAVATSGSYADLSGKPSSFSPSAHAASHKDGGADEIATTTPGPGVIPKTDGTGKIPAGFLPAGGSGASGTFYAGNPNGGFCSYTFVNGAYSSTTCPTRPFYWVLSGGQSLSTGFNAGPPLSATQPYSNVMLQAGMEGTTAPLIPLTENGTGENGSVETPSSGLANSLTARTAAENIFGVGLHGHNGTALAGLAKGTSYYSRGVTQCGNAAAWSAQQNYVFQPIAVTWTHGEWDYSGGLAAGYAAGLAQLQSDYSADVRSSCSATGPASIPVFLTQMNQGWTGELAEAQRQAHLGYPGRLILVGPKYQMAYGGDALHLTNTDSKWLGEYYAKAVKKVVFDKQTWNPLMPAAANPVARANGVITLTLSIPSTPLVIDTTNVAARANYGFSFSQTGGNSVSISDVSLVNNATQVQVTLSGTPTGGNQHLRYAWACPAGGTAWCGGAADATKVGGNIRDSDSAVSPEVGSTGKPLYNWLVAFDEPVPSAPAAPTGVSAAAGNGSATVSCTAAVSSYAVTGYTATSSPGGFTATGAACPLTVTGLANGTAYTFTVTAANAHGSSLPSAASGSVTPTAGSTPAWGEWNLSSNYTDTSGNGRNGTAAGSGNAFVTDPAGAHGTVLSLNGSGYVQLPAITPESYTKAAWVWVDSAANCYTTVGCNVVSSPGRDFLWISPFSSNGAPSNTTLRAGYIINGTSPQHFVWDTTTFPVDMWVHVAASYDSSTHVFKLYKNGVLISTATGGAQGTASSSRIGTFDAVLSTTLRGYLSKVRVWGSVLSDAEVASVAAQN